MIERLAGVGGMGVVYRAFDRLAGVPVALKVLGERGAADDARFAREAEVLAALHHPGIVRHVAHGVTSDGDRFLALEWLDGESLAERLARGGLTIAESVELGARIADALGAAHEQRVVHRDLKPSNLFLVGGRVEGVKILDFGVARAAGADKVTQTGVLLGTPGFIAPEQARGERAVDARADVFSLGCVLYRCITGKPAFAGEDVLAVLLKVALEDAPRLAAARADVAPALDALVASMLAKNPAERPADGAAVAEALRELGELTGAAAPPSVITSPVALTESEQRVMSLVLARLPARPTRAAPDAATLADEPGFALGAGLASEAARFGGQLAVLGDQSVLVAFGGWSANAAASATDHATSAARCALAMRDLEPGVAIAVVSGRAVVTARRVSGGTGNVPVGEVIDRGVTLLATASHGRIHLDDVTAALLGPRFVVASDGGGATLATARDFAGVARTLLGKETPCVGRDRELAALDAMFDECARESVARAALIVAPAGIGKSRLRWEFLRRVTARRPDVEVWMARGDPVAQGGAYAMLGSAVRRAAGVQGGEPAATSRAKIHARVARHVPASAVPRVAAFLGELAGVPFDESDVAELVTARAEPMILGDQMRRAWEDFVTGACAASPVVLVLDDLHWGDLPTAALVGATLKNLRDMPLLVIALARPELDPGVPKLWGSRVTQMPLEELTKRAAIELARAVLGPAADPATIEDVAARAGGNAFYLEELLRAVANGERALPETVLDVAAARLEAQPRIARRVLRAASVFGQVFWASGVSALLGGDVEEAELATVLANLAGDELVQPRETSRFSGERELIFRHALVQEAAHATLTATDAELGHRLAGAWLERVGERDAAVLAAHFERGGERARAASAYRRAAEQALAGNDFTGVLTRVERGFACGADGAELGALSKIAAEAHLWRGENVEALRSARVALDALPPRGAAWYGALADVATAGGRIGDRDALLGAAEALVAEEPTHDVRAAHVVAATRAAARLLVGGDPDLAERLLLDIERFGRPLIDADPALLGAMSGIQAIRALWAGDPSGYLLGMATASDAYARAGDRRNACMARVNMGSVLLEVGDYEGALASLEDGLAVAERLGIQPITALARCNIGLSLARLGRLEDGAAVEREAVRAFEAQGDLRMEGACRIYLAAILQLAGDLDGAEATAREACELLADLPATRACALGRLAAVLLERGDATAALEAATEAVDLLDSLQGTDEGEALARLVHAEALRATGEDGPAYEALAAARERVLERADRITHDAWRETFLTAVPENARTLELAEAWGFPG